MRRLFADQRATLSLQPFWIYDLLLIVAGDVDTFVFSCSTIDDAITLVKALNERDARRGAVDGSTAR